MDIASIIGLVIAIGGLVIGIWQLVFARKQTKLAEQQVDQTHKVNEPVGKSDVKPTLDKYQLTWLSALAKNSSRSESVDTRSILVSLRDQLPEDFDPIHIDPRFCTRGKQITLFGRAILNPNDQHVQQVNVIARAIRDMLINQPTKTQITATELSRITHLQEQEVAIILEEMAGYKGGGYFHNSGTNYGRFGWASINIEDDVLKRYINFRSVEDLTSSMVPK